MKALIDILSLCLGIFIYFWVTDSATVDMIQNMYWCVFGAGFITIKYKVWKS